MAIPATLINPRHLQPGNRQADIELQQVKIRMGKLEKANQELSERVAKLEAKPRPGRPPKERSAR